MARSQGRPRAASTSSLEDSEVVDNQGTTTSSRATRKAKAKAGEAWADLKPRARRKKSPNESRGGPDPDGTTAVSPPKITVKASKYRAPVMDSDAEDSDPENNAEDLYSAARVKSKSESSQGKDRHEPTTPGSNMGKTNTLPERSKKAAASVGSEGSGPSGDSGSDSDSKASGDDDDDQAAQDEDDDCDLQQLESNPRALKAQFDAEEPEWVEPDHSDNDRPSLKRRSNSGPAASRPTQPRVSPPLNTPVHTTSRSKKRVITSDASEDEYPRPQSRQTVDKVSREIAASKPVKKKAKSDNGPALHKTHPERTARARDDQRHATRKHGSSNTESAARATADTTSKKLTHLRLPAGNSDAPKRKREKPREDVEWARSDSDSPAKKRQRKTRAAQEPDDSDDDSSSSDSSDPDGSDDDDSIELVLSKNGGRLKLKKQRPRVAQVARRAVDNIQANVCLTNAFPDGAEKTTDFARKALLKAAKDLGDQEIVRRLKRDGPYCKKLTSIPVQRIPNFRGKVKRVTDAIAGNVYNLRPGDVQNVNFLQEGIRHIFPNNPAQQTVDGTKPYGIPVFAQVLRNAFFRDERSFGYRVVDRFESSLADEPNEKEIPAAMLALVSTALYASIGDYRNIHYKAGEFKANLFLDVYRQNMQTLSELKAERPRNYHNLMHNLYTEVCVLSGAPDARLPVKSFLNLKDMADE
ncbi:hypothetical protein C8Q76DRAFT_697139 [Earliella scabrosa]|nr:hypothetical protein C8Q76DRAFT_697139 [Earliella scabrosa]